MGIYQKGKETEATDFTGLVSEVTNNSFINNESFFI